MATELERKIMVAFMNADEAFDKSGGGTKHYFLECLMPELEKQGLTITEKPLDAASVLANIIQSHQAEIIRLEALVNDLTNELRTVTAKRVTAQGGVKKWEL